MWNVRGGDREDDGDGEIGNYRGRLGRAERRLAATVSATVRTVLAGCEA